MLCIFHYNLENRKRLDWSVSTFNTLLIYIQLFLSQRLTIEKPVMTYNSCLFINQNWVQSPLKNKFSYRGSDDEFQLLQRNFMDKYYQEFEDTEENKLTYTPIFNEYVSKFLFLIPEIRISLISEICFTFKIPPGPCREQ